MINIAQYLDPQTIIHIPSSVQQRDEALEYMIDLLERSEKLQDRQEFTKAIFDREKVVSTGIGMGLAIPHARLENKKDFVIAIGITQEGIDWNALDGEPVQLIFMIGGPVNQQTKYLKVLSELTFFLKEEEVRKQLLELTSKQDIVSLFVKEEEY